MPSQGYRDWVKAGKPYTLARPCRELQVLLRAAGYTVYDYPDDAHQLASTPEDHTPYSATGWPVRSARWVGHALDVMPKAGLLPLPALARRIIAARDAGRPGTAWIKYLNWTDESGRCWHERWAADGTRTTTTSTDKGHIHISARSDVDASDEVSRSGWNPLEEDMAGWTDADIKAIKSRMNAIIDMADNPLGDNLKPEPNELAKAVRAIAADLVEVKAQRPPTAAEIAAELIKQLAPPPA